MKTSSWNNIGAKVASAASCSLLMALAGCGGGGSGGLSSTPTPPPTSFKVPAPLKAPVNARLDQGNLESETFNTLSVHAAGTVSGSKVTNSSITDPSTDATVSYDASSDTYNFSSPKTSADGRTPDDATLSVVDGNDCYTTACVQVADSPAYINRRGVGGSNSSGFEYSYVTWGRWETQNGVTANSSQTMNYAVFGATTPAQAIPASGSARFSLDVSGEQITPISGTSGGHSITQTFTGTGTGTFDFGAGSYTMSGSFNSVPDYPSNVTFSSQGSIASGKNGFSGRMSYNDNGPFSGNLGGWFFGPNAEELGAVFSAAGPNGRVAIGAITGHR